MTQKPKPNPRPPKPPAPPPPEPLPPAARGLGAMAVTRTHFTFRVDTWTPDGESVVEHVAGVEDYQVALATCEPRDLARSNGANLAETDLAPPPSAQSRRAGRRLQRNDQDRHRSPRSRTSQV